MRKYVEIPLEVLERLVEGKCVEGSLRRDEWTGKVTFRAYQVDVVMHRELNAAMQALKIEEILDNV